MLKHLFYGEERGEIDTSGVTISETIYEYASLIPFGWVIGFGGIALFICFLGMLTASYDTIQNILTCLVVVAVVGMLVCGIGTIIKTDEVVGTRYIVSISNDVSFVEFYDHYDVIEGDGTIFTVKEKTDS